MIGYFVREWWKNKIIEQRSYNKHELCCCIKSSFACSNIREQPLSIRQAVRICSETWLNNTIILPSLFYHVNNAVARAIEWESAIWHNFQIWRGVVMWLLIYYISMTKKPRTHTHLLTGPVPLLVSEYFYSGCSLHVPLVVGKVKTFYCRIGRHFENYCQPRSQALLGFD